MGALPEEASAWYTLTRGEAASLPPIILASGAGSGKRVHETVCGGAQKRRYEP